MQFPTVSMLGNHRDRDVFRRLFGVGGTCGGFLQSTKTLGRFRLVFLDILSLGWDRGELCAARLDWLDRTLGEGGEACLFMHHPPCDIGDHVLDLTKLSNSDDLAVLLRKHRNVRQIFFGHVHRTMFLTWNGIPCASIGSLGDAATADLRSSGVFVGILAPGPEGLELTVRPLAR